MNYSGKIARLEEILASTGRGSLPRERSLALYREGLSIVGECRDFLTKAEGSIKEKFGDPQDVGIDRLEDSRLEEAIKIVLGTGVASSSGLQRQMRVGFRRAARMIDTMEALGIVGPQNGAKPREILVDEAGALAILEGQRGL